MQYQPDVAPLMRDEVSVSELVSWLLAQNGVPMLYSSASPKMVKYLQAEFGVNGVAAKLDRMFGEVAKLLVNVGIEGLIVAGGETSGAVV